MDAHEFLTTSPSTGSIIDVTYSGPSKSRRVDNWNYGLGQAAVVDKENRIAVMLTDLGNVDETNVRPGDIIQFMDGPEWPKPTVINIDTLRKDKLPTIPVLDT